MLGKWSHLICKDKSNNQESGVGRKKANHQENRMSGKWPHLIGKPINFVPPKLLTSAKASQKGTKMMVKPTEMGVSFQVSFPLSFLERCPSGRDLDLLSGGAAFGSAG